jgi:hypothetical protein
MSPCASHTQPQNAAEDQNNTQHLHKRQTHRRVCMQCTERTSTDLLAYQTVHAQHTPAYHTATHHEHMLSHASSYPQPHLLTWQPSAMRLQAGLTSSCRLRGQLPRGAATCSMNRKEPPAAEHVSMECSEGQRCTPTQAATTAAPLHCIGMPLLLHDANKMQLLQVVVAAAFMQPAGGRLCRCCMRSNLQAYTLTATIAPLHPPQLQLACAAIHCTPGRRTRSTSDRAARWSVTEHSTCSTAPAHQHAGGHAAAGASPTQAYTDVRKHTRVCGMLSMRACTACQTLCSMLVCTARVARTSVEITTSCDSSGSGSCSARPWLKASWEVGKPAWLQLAVR